tara:strand:- start:3363 stop:4223 length:861 start_codon:yes stop_codon:yes gene_type:complete
MINNEQTNNKIVFIASYMKSGNTWMRSIICSLINNGKFELEDLKKIKLFSQEVFFNKLPNIKYQKDGNIDFNFISKNWINAQNIINMSSKEKIKFFKTHNVRGLINNNYFTDENVCKGFVYLIRDPRDVCISLAKHMDTSIDNAIDVMLFQKNFVTNVFKVNEAVCTWKDHIESWVNFQSVPRLVIKYEDMILNIKNTIEQTINFLDIVYDHKYSFEKETINKTIDVTKFSHLQKLEKTGGFSEATNNNFFRKGKAGEWKNILSKEQILLIEKELGTLMSKLGYLV